MAVALVEQNWEVSSQAAGQRQFVVVCGNINYERCHPDDGDGDGDGSSKYIRSVRDLQFLF